MKTIKLFILLAFVAATAFAQGNYEKTMSSSIMEVYQAKDAATYDQLSNRFNRIAQAESDQWEPRYYEALSHVFKSFDVEDPTVKDAILDQAHVALNAAVKIAQNNSEIIALQGFVDMMKVNLDPATRGQSLTPKVMAAFGKAMALDPNNPRATFFMAQMQIGTSKFFGTPITEPCAMIEKANDLFNNARPTSPLAPMWGQRMVGRYQEMCASGEAR